MCDENNDDNPIKARVPPLDSLYLSQPSQLFEVESSRSCGLPFFRCHEGKDDNVRVPRWPCIKVSIPNHCLRLSRAPGLPICRCHVGKNNDNACVPCWPAMVYVNVNQPSQFVKID